MIMNRLLQGVLAPGGTAGTAIHPEGEMEAAAKTGTTTDNHDFTFVGLTPIMSPACGGATTSPTTSPT